MSASVDISKFLGGLGKGKARGVAAAVMALDQFGEHVIGDAQQLTPVDTGALQASGTTEPATVKGSQIQKVIGFNIDYAAAVHERLDVHHDVGQAKYLSTAVVNDAPKMKDFVIDQVKKAL